MSDTASSVPVKSPLIDRVAAFLANPDEFDEHLTITETNAARENRTVRPSITVCELNSWKESAHACSHVAQLYLLIRKICKSRPGAQFCGMKQCLAGLKALKAVRAVNKNCRRRDNMEVLQRGVTIVDKFLVANRTDSAVAESLIQSEPSDEKRQTCTCVGRKHNATTPTDAEAAERMNIVSEKPTTCNRLTDNHEQKSSASKLFYVPETGLYEYLLVKVKKLSYLAKLRKQLLKSKGQILHGKSVVHLARKNLQKLLSLIDKIDTFKRKRKARSLSKLLQVIVRV